MTTILITACGLRLLIFFDNWFPGNLGLSAHNYAMADTNRHPRGYMVVISAFGSIAAVDLTS